MRPRIEPARRPDRQASLKQYRSRARFYDAELLLFEPIRTEAIARLDVHPGDCVFDVGCGTGLSFERLHTRVGKAGRVVGIEQSPDMMALAKAKVAQHGWSNVDLVQAPAATAKLKGMADAALFHFTHDILREEASLANVFAHLKPGARVVAAGLQWAAPWAWPANGFVLMAAMYSTTSLEGLGEPWSLLAPRLVDFRVRQMPMGGIYMASGRFDPRHH
jgi:demethylmenaquinone methyltransferase/2-methoxy-6-polyprenyl-1,4-benzoquinol methylase